MQLIEFKESDIQKWHDVFEFVKESVEEQGGLYYLLKNGDSEKVVYKCDNFFAVFYFLDEEIYYNVFEVDENGVVINASFDEFAICKSGSLIIIKREEVFETVDFIKSYTGPRYDGYDGVFQYTQSNSEMDEQLILYYQHMSREDGKVFREHLVNPYLIIFQSNLEKGRIKSITYVKNEFDYYDNQQDYDLLTIKEYGLFNFLKNGSYELQKENKLVRYYKVFMETPKCLMTGFPFLLGDRLEKLKKVIEKKGFKTEVPDYAISLWNNTYENLNEFQMIADLFMRLDVAQDEKLVLRYGKN